MFALELLWASCLFVGVISLISSILRILNGIKDILKIANIKPLKIEVTFSVFNLNFGFLYPLALAGQFYINWLSLTGAKTIFFTSKILNKKYKMKSTDIFK